MGTTTILKLPAQPLPEVSMLEGISVTIWFFGCSVATGAFYHSLKGRLKTARSEFSPIFIGTALLTIWYFFIVLDRWLHHAQNRVVYGYIFALPVIESFRIASTVYYLWGTYIVIWRELEDRFPRKQQVYWWRAARCAIFTVGFVSIYYVLLSIVHVSVWVRFLSLNTIADVATKWVGFEITMTAFFFVFGLISFAAACASLLWKSWRMDGQPTRVYLLLAALLLLIRSIFEFALAIRAWGPYSTRQSLQPVKDVEYGIITLTYLGSMYITAHVISSKFDKGSKGVRLIYSDIRHAVLEQLRGQTENGRQKSPPLMEIANQIDIDKVLRDGTLPCNVKMSSARKDRAARLCLRELKAEYGNLDPREGGITAPGTHLPSRLSLLRGVD
ncbi:hypothetical protein GGR58DRAFT_507032 [Xylaria digitata]|nr:hypothetical protein GGR58DRAFT_507032 [Xylaria digitata]